MPTPRIVIIAIGLWIALWSLVLTLSVRDLLDANIDSKIANVMGDGKYNIISGRFKDLSIGMVFMSITCLTQGIVVAISPHPILHINLLLRIVSAAAFILCAMMVLGFKCVALYKRYVLTRQVNNSFFTWLVRSVWIPNEYLRRMSLEAQTKTLDVRNTAIKEASSSLNDQHSSSNGTDPKLSDN